MNGGAINLHGGGKAKVINSIIWGNEPDEINLSGISTATITFSNIEGGWGVPADMNIDADPLFLAAGNGDYRLAFESECINAGDDIIPMALADTYDVDQDEDTDEATPDLNLITRIINGFIDMGGYEYDTSTCPWDLDGSGAVGTGDLLALFAQWGTAGPADFDGSGAVNTSDLLILFANWGGCPESGMPPPPTLEEALANACLTPEDWVEYVEVITGPASQTVKDRYQCWMTHYLEDCNKCFCFGGSGCPAPDPFN